MIVGDGHVIPEFLRNGQRFRRSKHLKRDFRVFAGSLVLFGIVRSRERQSKPKGTGEVMIIQKDYKFYAAHRNETLKDKCSNLHGHRYGLRCFLKSNAMVILVHSLALR